LIIDDALAAFFEGGASEIDEKVDGEAEKAEVGGNSKGQVNSGILNSKPPRSTDPPIAANRSTRPWQ
jgi:hypothetical protein